MIAYFDLSVQLGAIPVPRNGLNEGCLLHVLWPQSLLR